MADNRNMLHALYGKLLTLYPRAFRERLGESMEQTFSDRYSEIQQTQHGVFGFTLWVFTETAVGIAQEHIFTIKENQMKNILTHIKSPAFISLLLVVPFMILEMVSTRDLNTIFNIPLFGVMWLLPLAFLLILTPIVRNMRTGNSITAKPVTFVFSIIFLILIAFVWVSIVADQMPCFLGVPNCD